MEREREIRQALNSFLPAPSRPESGPAPGRPKMDPPFGPSGRHAPSKLTFSEAQRDILSDLQQAKNLRILVLDSRRDNPLAERLKRSAGTTMYFSVPAASHDSRTSP